MPLINLRTSLASVDDADGLLQQLSSLLAEQTGKPEAYVMTLLETGVPMTFAGSPTPPSHDRGLLRSDQCSNRGSSQQDLHRL